MPCCWRCSPGAAPALWCGSDRALNREVHFATILPYQGWTDNRRIAVAMTCALIETIMILFNVVWWIIIVQAIMSWLIVFNVINMGNSGLRQIWDALNKMTEPLYAPIRRILPDFGGLDLSPLVVILLLGFVQRVIANSAPVC
jgi:YggT family protein